MITSCSKTKIFSKADNQIEMLSNNTFQIELPENHTNGENWVIIQDFDAEKLAYNKSNFVNIDGKGNGKVTFYFESLLPSNIQLKFKLIQYKDSVAVHAVNLKIK
jgi:hypothetical protein